jgi:hypothetical protein
MDRLELGGEGFERLFAEVIVPVTAPFEAERRRHILAFWVMVLISAVLGVLATLVGMIFLSPWVGLVVFVIGVAVGRQRLKRFANRCKEKVLGALTASLGMTYAHECQAIGLDELRTFDLVPPFERSSFEDRFAGERHGCAFELCEAKLETTKHFRDEQWRVVFRGQVIRIHFPQRFATEVVLRRAGGKPWKREGFQRIGLVGSGFEKLFEVYGRDQVESRFLVHPAFMERLIALERASAGHKLRAAFVGGDLLIAMEAGDLFEVVDPFKPFPNFAGVKKGVEELAQVIAVIDAVVSPPPRAYAASAGAGD